MSGFGAPSDVPRWVSVALIPLVNLLLAFLISGLVVLVIGENPIDVAYYLANGAFGSFRNFASTLYFSTNLIFTGLAVAVAFHCGLFNIGGEGQAYIGGLGVGLVCLYLDFLPWPVLLPFAIVAGVVFGGAWAFIPAYLQAKRGSHIVITTIMFNFIAATLMVYLMVNVLIAPGQQSPESRRFLETATIPNISEVMAWIGVEVRRVPLNLSFLVAIAAAVFVWVFVWHTRWGYELRAVGQSHRAAVYGGISVDRNIILAMCISGGLAGLVGINDIMGYNERILLNFVGGAGFVGIAVALMGRNHPVGIVLAAILFGALIQGGAELSFDIPTINRDMVVVIQGLVIMFSGGLENMFRPQIETLFRRRSPGTAAAQAD